MRKLGSILAVILLTTSISYSKKNAVVIRESHYGIGISQINAGTGHGNGYTMSANIVKGRKSLEVGLIYSEKDERLSGGDFRYRIFLGNIHELESDQKIYKPYLQYNLLYQKSISYASDIIKVGDETYEIPTDPGLVATIGHFISYGNKIRVVNRLYIDSSLGLGIYRGSLDKSVDPGTWGIHNENGGMTFSFKIGLGYTFN